MITEATAPGKIILCGEHAVVYGRPAIAVPVSQVEAKATLNPAKTGFRIITPDLLRDYRLDSAPTDDPIASIINLTLAQFDEPPPNVTLELTATIPLGRGLGSGAAISTVIVRVLAQFFNQPLNTNTVSDLVFEVEKLYHGTPSGIDNTVIAYQQPVYFVRGRPIQRLRVKRPFCLVIGDTGVVAPTLLAVGGVRERWQTNREQYEGYFDEIDGLVRQIRVIVEQGIGKPSALGKLMNENQEILEQLGVSSPELERLVQVARQAGAWGAKLSGAGQGGNMIALVEPAQANTVAHALYQTGATGVIISQVG
ncbi:mevalonate kinase [Anaerolineales bacterium HSG24]|nr:mevalonate kinase [Anaerolineales bacterium HSG24]